MTELRPRQPEAPIESRIDLLHAEHRKLDARLRDLEQHLSLSPDEQRERAELKKTKLQLKDQILSLERAR